MLNVLLQAATQPQGSSLAFLMVMGGVAGAVCGVLPLNVARRRRKLPVGVACLLLCTLVGAQFGLLLALPAAILLATGLYFILPRGDVQPS